MLLCNEANHPEFSSPDAPLAKWFRSLNDGAARIRGNIEGWFDDTFGGSSAGLSPNVGGHAVLVGKSASISKLWDVNGQSCTVYTECTKYGPGILVSAGVDIETNFSSMPMQEGATSSTIGVFAEGGLGEVMGGSLNVDQSGQSTQSTLPLPMPSFDVGKLKLGLGAGAAAGIQHCVSEVMACSG